MTVTLEELWPPFGLTITVGQLKLRAMRDTDLPDLVDAASAGIHGEELRPFPRDWASRDPVSLGRDLASRYWKYRRLFHPTSGRCHWSRASTTVLSVSRAQKPSDTPFSVLPTRSRG